MHFDFFTDQIRNNRCIEINNHNCALVLNVVELERNSRVNTVNERKDHE